MAQSVNSGGCLFLVVGPSGAGKDSVIAAAKKQLEMNGRLQSVVFVRRTITRKKQNNGSKDYEDHIYTDINTFVEQERTNLFFLSWKAHGYSYGVPRSILSDLKSGKDVVANVSRTVILEARCKYSFVCVIYITADDDIRKERILNRGRESEREIQDRITHEIEKFGDNEEIPFLSCGDVVVSNNAGEIDNAVDQFVKCFERN